MWVDPEFIDSRLSVSELCTYIGFIVSKSCLLRLIRTQRFRNASIKPIQNNIIFTFSIGSLNIQKKVIHN